MGQSFYLQSNSAFGFFGIVWREPAQQPKILQVYLPVRKSQLEDSIRKDHPLAVEKSRPEMDLVAADLCLYLEGKAVVFGLEWLDWDRCTIFQSRVLRAEYAIPRGWVSTYGRIARELGSADAARAVGGALAANPFPLLIPCHRAVRSDGELGGYQGGLEMKKALLEMEGVEFRSPNRVSLKKVYYSM